MPFRFQQAGMAWGRGLFGLLLLLILVAAIAWFVMTLARQSAHTHHEPIHSRDAPAPQSSDALKILSERFARGEIDAEEFTQRRDLLRSST